MHVASHVVQTMVRDIGTLDACSACIAKVLGSLGSETQSMAAKPTGGVKGHLESILIIQQIYMGIRNF